MSVSPFVKGFIEGSGITYPQTVENCRVNEKSFPLGTEKAV